MCASFVKEISTMFPCCKFMWFPCQPEFAITQLLHSAGTMTSGLCTLQLSVCLCVCMCGRVLCAPPLRLLRYRHSDNWVWPSFIGTVLNQLNPATQSFVISLNLCLTLSPRVCLSLTHLYSLCIFLYVYLMLLSFNKPCFLARHQSSFLHSCSYLKFQVSLIWLWSYVYFNKNFNWRVIY